MQLTTFTRSMSDTIDEPKSKRQRVASLPHLGEDDIIKKPIVQNDYAGFRLPVKSNKQDGKPIPTLANPISPQSFFTTYISKRRPCILDYHPTKDAKRIILSPSLMERCLGDEVVQVEKRKDTRQSFGKSRREGDTQVTMPLKEFLGCLRSKDGENLYLSTQESEDDDGKFTTPCRQLVELGILPENIDIAGNLVRHACNLWMGRSDVGSSSGLHHDYHDNFLFLISGRKRIRLYDPSCTPFIPLRGTPTKVYYNGRICYEGEKECGPDGIPISMLFTKRNFDILGDCAGSLIDSDEECGEDEVVLGKGFDYESVGDDGEGGFPADEEGDDFDEIFIKDTNDLENGKAKDSAMGGANFPPANNFSLIPPSLLGDEDSLRKFYPDFSALCPGTVVELKAGQMLYLPAGWFHEVTSFSSGVSSENEEAPGNNFHAAVNYWFHPPDLLSDFDFPYRNEFWRRRKP